MDNHQKTTSVNNAINRTPIGKCKCNRDDLKVNLEEVKAINEYIMSKNIIFNF